MANLKIIDTPEIKQIAPDLKIYYPFKWVNKIDPEIKEHTGIVFQSQENLDNDGIIYFMAFITVAEHPFTPEQIQTFTSKPFLENSTLKSKPYSTKRIKVNGVIGSRIVTKTIKGDNIGFDVSYSFYYNNYKVNLIYGAVSNTEEMARQIFDLNESYFNKLARKTTFGMKQKANKKGWIITGIILALLLITNPSIKRFKDFQGETSYDGLRRKMNFGIVSVYSYEGKLYLGLLWNFIYLKEDDNYYGYRRPPSPKKPIVRRQLRPSKYE